ncbi:N-acetylneuraminate synthase family protein [uncultured Nonlabens sp.]|jgi:sialic acid synthase SpsE|uniref:N-acetylneuraminate synthase family protein n=1 Tax=uncultured Nonlabens sp. TaxID=859306 RepID=UPI0030DB9E43|tara:strand:+ start:498 stop:1535 length:1038 start_codon:yes stop_codon:yes gene_type:complete
MSTYVIGEIGQNHNGSVDVAKLLVDVVSRPVHDKLFNNTLPVMDAVKLTKRDLTQELSQSQMDRPYDTPNSFGKTYGEHREFLELNDEEHFEVYKYAKEKGLDFVETLCAIGCLSMFKYFTPDKLKVASRDLTNLPLLAALAETKVPMIVSTGMAGKKELDEAVEVITRYHSDLSILHCVSEYPTRYENVNLRTISYLKKNYSQFKIGYSDHTIGIATPIAAIGMGAEIIEKHITLDRGMKGTDQAGSLAIDGIYRMMRDIRNLDMSLGKEEIYIEPSVVAAREKLERSIATKTDLKTGDTIREEDLHLLSPGNGFKWVDKDLLIGKKVKTDIAKNEIIYKDHVK